MNSEVPGPKSKVQSPRVAWVTLDIGPGTLDFIRHSSLVIRHWQLLAMIVFFSWLSAQAGATQPEALTQEQFVQLFDSNRVTRATILYDPQSPYLHDVTGAYYKDNAAQSNVLEKGSLVEAPFKARIRLTEQLEKRLLASGVVTARPPARTWLEAVYSLLPFLVVGIVISVIVVLLRVFGMGGNDR